MCVGSQNGVGVRDVILVGDFMLHFIYIYMLFHCDSTVCCQLKSTFFSCKLFYISRHPYFGGMNDVPKVEVSV
jgi:hypothetical protein